MHKKFSNELRECPENSFRAAAAEESSFSEFPIYFGPVWENDTARFPHAILHFDGDAFFASVEQMMDYRLRGKPVITGGERGAATSLSYEAKRRGVHRGMPLAEIKIRCPDAIIVASDYTAYSMYARRMYAIVRQYTPHVDEYSIDECFADITGLNETMHLPYEEIAARIKEELEESMGITFGVGLAPSKTIAKIASKAHKPAGFTPIGMSDVQTFLEATPIHEVWGLGGVSGTKLRAAGAETAFAFSQKDDAWLTMHHFGKAYRDIWLELRGQYIKKVEPPADEELPSTVGSMMRTRTFTPPSMDRWFVLSQLSKNVEEVCEKARRHRVKARGLSFYLKTQEFTYHSVSIELTVPTVSPIELLRHIYARFDEVFAEGILYRASGVTIRGLLAAQGEAHDLFGEMETITRKSTFIDAIDAINKKFGRHTVSLGSSMQALTHKDDIEASRRNRRINPARERFIISPEHRRKTLYLPYLGVVK